MTVRDGDVFITKLERDFYGAFRVLRSGLQFDFTNLEVLLIAVTSYIDTVKPDINDERLKEILWERRFSFAKNPKQRINLYTGKNLEKQFEYLGNIPLTAAESDLPTAIGDGGGKGFPLCGPVQKGFGFQAFMEWRWEHERDAYIKDVQDQQDKREAALQERKTKIRESGNKSLMEAYRYQDDKSDKFWRIEYAGMALAVTYGKTGTLGRCKVKEFTSEQACEKEVRKLIASKVKKGYVRDLNVDRRDLIYFDDSENGLHPLSSHPQFREYFKHDFYYDCADEEAPFGSDEGSDTLSQIEADFRKRKSFDFVSFPQKLVEVYWDMTYIPADDLSPQVVEQLVEKDEMNLIQSDMVTYAAAFAQIKITGKVDCELKEAALNAMRRLALVAKIRQWNTTGEPSEIGAKMINDLENFTG